MTDSAEAKEEGNIKKDDVVETEESTKKEDDSTKPVEEAVTVAAKKDEPAASEAAPLDPVAVEAVAERLRFFFSDANVRQDPFVRKHLIAAGGTAYPHQLTVEALLRFNTIKQYTTDPAVVVAATKTVHLKDKLKVSEDGKAIGRVVPFTMSLMDGNIPLSLCVGNLPFDEHKQYKFKPEDLRQLFTEYGHVAMVKLLFDYEKDNRNGGHHHKKGGDFKKHRQIRIPTGFAFVEFEELDSLEKAAADTLTTKDGETLEPKRKLELAGSVLSVMPMKEHIEALKGKGKDNDKKRGAEGEPVSGQVEGEEKEAGRSFKLDWKPGCVIRLEGLPADCDREAILEAVATGLEMPPKEVQEKKIYADFSRGQENGAIRFLEPADFIKTFCEKLSSGEVKIKNASVRVARVLEGDEETNYWKDFIDFKNKQRQHKNNDRGGGHNKFKHKQNYNKRARR